MFTYHDNAIVLLVLMLCKIPKNTLKINLFLGIRVSRERETATLVLTR